MQIPRHFLGRWRGQVVDLERAAPYSGEIEIGEDAVHTRYDLKQGIKAGELTLEYAAGGFIVLREDVGSFHGKLLLYMDNQNNLKCVWTHREKYQCEATMRKAD